MKSVFLQTLLVLLLINFVSINNITYSQSLYRVSGNVFLEDKLPGGPHDGVTIRFYTLPGKILKDSTTSQTNGSYSKLVAPGYYLVEWTKAGYVFEELGGLALVSVAKPKINHLFIMSNNHPVCLINGIQLTILHAINSATYG